jgi:multidrug resistance efflux pump
MAQAQVPVIAFVDTSSSYAIAVLGQNAIRHIRAGNPAEVALILQPGKIFNASVEEVVQASAQQTATGLISAQPESSLPMGSMAVRLKIDSAIQPAHLPSGANGAVAIYTESGKPLRIIRKVIIRMFTWMNFLP